MMPPRKGGAPRSETARVSGPVRETQTQENARNSAVGTAAPQGVDSPFADRRRFLIWAAMAGFVGPERVTERILADLSDAGAEWGRT